MGAEDRSGLAADRTRPQTTRHRATNLFPFLDGYGVYAGACSSNNPALAPTSNSALLPTYTPTPGQVLTMTTANDIRMPSINVQRRQRQRQRARHGRHGHRSRRADGGCTNTFPNQVTASKTTSTTYRRTMPEPGFPYGTYKICAQATATAGPHGHADIYTGSTPSYDAKSTGHAP